MVRRLFALAALSGSLFVSTESDLFAQGSAGKTTTAKPGPAAPAAAKPAPPAADPAVNKVLEDWYAASKNIKKLEGEHKRYVYQYAFGVLKQSEGQFYYESPDKGRIDLSAVKVKDGQELEKVHPFNGKSVKFAVQSDVPERWICDGKQILQIDDAKKEVQQFSIPPEGQGQNIMDGPLPFLFGMPPEKAHQRFMLRLLKQDTKKVTLQALPKWQQDAANYKSAVIILERSTMLPEAVQLIDPAETTETVFTFPKITKNPSKPITAFLRIPGSDPFKPNLKDYKFVSAGASEPIAKGPKTDPAAIAVPSVVGLDHEEAQKVLEKSGFKVKVYEGEPADTPQLAFHVYRQEPLAKASLKKGETVRLLTYKEPKINLTEGKQGATTAAGGVPKVIGMNFQEAKQRLEKAGYKVKFVKGDLAESEDEVHTVQDQAPKAGVKLEPEATVTLKLLIDNVDADKSGK